MRRWDLRFRQKTRPPMSRAMRITPPTTAAAMTPAMFLECATASDGSSVVTGLAEDVATEVGAELKKEGVKLLGSNVGVLTRLEEMEVGVGAGMLGLGVLPCRMLLQQLSVEYVSAA